MRDLCVIDDDVAKREALATALGEAGYRTVCFADGTALLSQLRAQAPACVLLEVRLPDRDGLDILKKLGQVGKSLEDFSLDTVRMFRDDAVAAGYRIECASPADRPPVV